MVGDSINESNVIETRLQWLRLDRFSLFLRLKNVQTPEELRDVHTHFILYYSNDLPEMQKLQRIKEKKNELEDKKCVFC